MSSVSHISSRAQAYSPIRFRGPPFTDPSLLQRMFAGSAMSHVTRIVNDCPLSLTSEIEVKVKVSPSTTPWNRELPRGRRPSPVCRTPAVSDPAEAHSTLTMPPRIAPRIRLTIILIPPQHQER